MSGIGHNSQAVAQASYADFKLVKTRSTAQIVLEIPIEEAGAFVDAFGLPIPGHEIHVAVARLQVPAKDGVSRAEPRREKKEATAAVDTNKSSDARDRFRSLGKPEQTVAKCAMLCSSPQFWEFLGVSNEEQAASRIREELGVKSRSELAGDEIAQRIWERMVTDYDLWRQALPEMRG